jgi:hypothetical protein
MWGGRWEAADVQRRAADVGKQGVSRWEAEVGRCGELG